MKNKYLPFILICGFIFFTGCKEEALPEPYDPSQNGVFEYAETETDQWIKENLTRPYNIVPIWRWTNIESDMGKNLVPPKEQFVIPYLRLIKITFIDMYDEQAGEIFTKKLMPKQFLLIGSSAFNKDGTITLGQAEGGKKIYLYAVNQFMKPGELKQSIHTMHHEFCHIMHQTKTYNKNFRDMSKGRYTTAWMNGSEEEAHAQGFVSKYARLNPDEDFVETYSIYLTTPATQWDAMLAKTSEKSKEGARLILQKLNFVRSYMKQSWKIDLDKFRDELEIKLKKIDNNLPKA